jgi:histidine triad (HIT) family protein
MISCVFCDILAEKLPSSIILQDDVCGAFMDIQPVNPGHVLIIPTYHAPFLAELDESGAHMFRMAQRVAKALRASGIPRDGVNLFLADGAAAGQKVFHVHLHRFPRCQGDGFGLRFGPEYGHRPPRAELDGIAGKLRGAL